jgi:hypothetical protein
MILLTAFRTDMHGSCRFKIEADGSERETSDPVKAAKILFRMGVSAPLQLVEHARQWGSVEIVEPSTFRH